MPGSVRVSVFTNFEGWLTGSDPQADRAVAWFRECATAYPEIVWTHLYSPAYLLVEDGIDAVFTPYLLDVARNEGAEIGIHAHLFLTWVARAGVNPRATPDASTDDCTAGTTPGYGVLLTGYEEDERARIVDASIQGLTFNGFPPPTTFCAGYSAADPRCKPCWTAGGLARASPLSRCRRSGIPRATLAAGTRVWRGQGT